MSEINREIPLLVIGGGPGGYPAALHAADHGMKVLLVDAEPGLGGVCTNRGCIPSKALLHIAKLIHEAKDSESWGVTFGPPKVDFDKLRTHVQTKVIGKLNSGIAMLCKGRGVDVIKGTRASFVDSNTVKLEGETTGTIRFEKCIISTGSIPAMPKAFNLGDPRIMDSTGALALPDVPKRMLIIGGGYIGLEIGTVYAALGTKIVVVEFTDGLLPLADRDLVRPLEKILREQFEAIHLNTKVASLEATPKGIVATLEGKDIPPSETFDRVLISVGRRPNSAGLGLEKTKVKLDERGYITVDGQRRTSEPHILAIGDVAGEPGLAHKATAEAKVAVETLLGEPAEFAPRAIPAVVFTDPEISWAGLTEREANEQGVAFEKLTFPWAASGRATTIGRNEGMTKMLVDPESKRVLGVGIVGAGAGEMIAEAVLAIEMGAVARDVADSIHPHPTLSETVMESAELALGAATHLAKPKKVARQSHRGSEIQMPLLLDDRQLLPPGLYDASLEEVDARFAGFQKSDRRIQLFRRLRLFLDDVRGAFPRAIIIIDGSFVMGCVDEPSDIDLVLVLPAEVDLRAEFKPHQYNVISKRRVRQEYRFHCRAVTLGSIEEEEAIQYFCQVNPKWCKKFGWPMDSIKGLVRLFL